MSGEFARILRENATHPGGTLRESKIDLGAWAIAEERRLVLERRRLAEWLWPQFGWWYARPLVPTYADVRERLRREQPGTWRETVRWPHEEVEHDGHVVPAYLVGDPERAAWRRRKWWGRHVLEVDAIGQWYRWWPW